MLLILTFSSKVAAFGLSSLSVSTYDGVMVKSVASDTEQMNEKTKDSEMKKTSSAMLVAVGAVSLASAAEDKEISPKKTKN